MIDRHVDLIAVALLVIGMAICAQMRRTAALELNVARRNGFINHRNSTIIVVPPAPPRPTLPFTRD